VIKKATLIILTSVLYTAALAQSNTTIERQASDLGVKISSIKPAMDENVKKIYKIKIYNGGKKTIIAVELKMNFTEFRPYNSKPDENRDCIKNEKFKIIIKRISSATVIVNALENFPCQGLPSVVIKTVVFSDGTFIERSKDTLGYVDNNN
jgi:hypothetical protein